MCPRLGTLSDGPPRWSQAARWDVASGGLRVPWHLPPVARTGHCCTRTLEGASESAVGTRVGTAPQLSAEMLQNDQGTPWTPDRQSVPDSEREAPRPHPPGALRAGRERARVVSWTTSPSGGPRVRQRLGGQVPEG